MAPKPPGPDTISPRKRMAQGKVPSGADAVKSFTSVNVGKPITSKSR